MVTVESAQRLSGDYGFAIPVRNPDEPGKKSFIPNPLARTERESRAKRVMRNFLPKGKR